MVDVSFTPTAIDVDGVEMEVEDFDGLVKIVVDSTADCIRAIQLCGNGAISIEKSRGPGFEEFEAQTSCQPNGEEFQSKWFRFDILESGTLEFMIKPKGDASYGFSLYKNDCPNNGNSEAVDCEPGLPILEGRVIGAATDPMTSFGELDDAGTNFIPSVTTNIGETYFLLVDNYSDNGIGFDLSFAGTAIIGDETLQSKIADPAILNCTNPTINLDARASTQGLQYESNWTTDTGSINTSINFYEPSISKGGTFYLVIKDRLSGCVSLDSVFVSTDMEFPLAKANESGILDCNQPTLNINAAGSSIGNNFEITWTNLTQSIPNLPSNNEITVDEGGNYELKITNSINGCISRDSILILEDFVKPQLSKADNFISCQAPIANLAANSTTVGVVYEWSSGNLVNPLSEPEIEVNDTGYFKIKVVAPNGCMTTDSVYVADDRIFPIIEVGDSLIIDCDNPTISLNGNGSSEGANFQYLWTSQKGHFVNESEVTILNPAIDSSGFYKLSITNTSNGCISVDSVYVDSSFKKPAIIIEADSILNCYAPSLIIDASKSDSGAIFEFEWFGQDGKILQNDDTYQPSVNEAGAYIFNIKNTENGCIATQLWDVKAEDEVPIAVAGMTETLNCTQPILTLDGSQSSQGEPFKYQWTSQNGNFITDDTTIMVDVDSAGIYMLSVLNVENGCESLATVTISKDFAIPELSIPNDSTLTCRNPKLILTASSETENTNFTWFFPDSSEVENPTIETEIAGAYIITVKAANGCIKEKTLKLATEQILPIIQIEEPELLTCINETVTIDGVSSDNGNPFELEWTTEEGLFIDENQSNIPNPEVKQGGLYYLKITNTETGCISLDSAKVPSSIDRPTIIIDNPPEIYTCVNSIVEVEATSDVDNAEYQWKLASEVLSNTPLLEATGPGIYTIIVMNPANSCTSLSSVQIFVDTIKPIADAGETKELNCTIGTVQLDGSASSEGDEFSYLWTNQTNETLAEAQTIEVTLPGLYNLIIINQNNGCRTLDTVSVTESRDNPIANAGKDTLYCSGAEALDFLLGGMNTSQGENFEYVWTTNQGEMLGIELTQRVNLSGIYSLQVTNTDNDCVTMDSITVFKKPRPVISLTINGGINCLENEIIYLAESDINTTKLKWVGEFEVDSNTLVVTDALLAEQFVAIGEDTITGCLGSSDVIRVTEDRLLPLLNAGDDTEVNCSDTLRLDGQILSAVIPTEINWRTEDGNIVTSKNELNPIVDAAGTYILKIENRENFCVNEDTIVVITNQILPTVDIGADRILTCNEPMLTIFPDSLSIGNNYYYFWKDINNKILSTEDNLKVEFPGIYQLLVVDSTNLCTKSDVVEAHDSTTPPLIIIEQPDKINCFNHQIIVNTNINIEDGTYEWTILSDTGNILGSKNSPNVVVNEAGIYQIEVTNNFSGCIAIKNIAVQNIKKDIYIEAGGNKTITCNNNSTVIATGTIFTESPDLIYEWTSDNPNFEPIDTTLTIEIRETGIYFLNVTDTISQCTTGDAFEVDRDVEAIQFDLMPSLTIDCANETVTLGDLNALNQPTYIYQWTTEDGNIVGEDNIANVVASRAGTYQIFIENSINGCTYLNEQMVNENTQMPDIDIGEASLLTCVNEEAIIGGDNTAIGDNFSYEWTTVDGNILEGIDSLKASVNKAGTYTLTVRDANNSCESTATVNILAEKEFPRFTLSDDLSFVCTDESIAINFSSTEDLVNLKAEWQTPNGILLSESNSFTAQVAAPGWYYVTVEDLRNNCVALDSVLVNDNRALPDVTTLADQMLGCANESITLDAQGSAMGDNIGYKWLNESGNTLSNNTTLTIDEAGQYILQVTNRENTCVDADTVQITKNNNPPTGANLIIESPTCDGANNGFIEVAEVIGGTEPYGYALDASEATFIGLFPDLAPQTYTLTIFDDLDCQWDTTILLNQPQAIDVKLVTADNQLLTGETAVFTVETSIPEAEVAEIIWTPSNIINCDDCQEVSTSFLVNTTVGVTVIDLDGCEGSDSVNIAVEIAPVPNAITPNGDGANDFFMVPEIEQNPDAYPDSELIIFNRWGDVLYRASPYNNDWEGTNNSGQPLGEGTYYYVLRLDTREGEFKKGDITILRR